MSSLRFGSGRETSPFDRSIRCFDALSNDGHYALDDYSRLQPFAWQRNRDPALSGHPRHQLRNCAAAENRSRQLQATPPLQLSCDPPSLNPSRTTRHRNCSPKPVLPVQPARNPFAVFPLGRRFRPACLTVQPGLAEIPYFSRCNLLWRRSSIIRISTGEMRS